MNSLAVALPKSIADKAFKLVEFYRDMNNIDYDVEIEILDAVLGYTDYVVITINNQTVLLSSDFEDVKRGNKAIDALNELIEQTQSSLKNMTRVLETYNLAKQEYDQ